MRIWSGLASVGISILIAAQGVATAQDWPDCVGTKEDARLNGHNLALCVTNLAKADTRVGRPLIEEREITLKRADTLDIVLRGIGATPDQIRSIGSALATAVKLAALPENLRMRILLAPGPRPGDSKGIARVILLSKRGIEAIAASTDGGVFVPVALPVSEARTPRARLNVRPVAIFSFDDPANPQVPKITGGHAGHATWWTDAVNAGQERPFETTISALVEVPDAEISLSLLIQRNLDPALPASHTVELAFTTRPGDPSQVVREVGLLQFKNDMNARGAPVAGLPVPVRDNLFLIGLSNLPGDLERNMELLRRRDWIDLPIRMASGQWATISLEKGASGENATAAAFWHWQQAAHLTGSIGAIETHPIGAIDNPVSNPQRSQAETKSSEAIPLAPSNKDASTSSDTDQRSANPAPNVKPIFFSVQLAVNSNLEEAKVAYSKLHKKYPELKNSQMIAREAVVNGNKIYRLRAGPFAKAKAVDLCAKISKAGDRCFVAAEYGN